MNMYTKHIDTKYEEYMNQVGCPSGEQGAGFVLS